MNNEIKIRQATIEDLNELAQLFDTYREYFGQQRNYSMAVKFLFDRFQHLESVIFIAERADEFVGFAQVYPVFSSLSLERVWLLNDFFIKEHYRNKGVGKELFKKVKEYSIATCSKGIELSVEHSNKKAWNFWEKLGFTLDEEFRYYLYKL